MMQEAAQKVAEKVLENTPIVTGAGTAAGSVSGILTVVQGWVGVGIAVGGFIINWWYKAKKDQREEQEHEDRLTKGK